MAVRKFKPVTPGTRHKIIGTFDEITTNKPEKSLLCAKKSTGGRNNSGKMTVRYIGGGHKQMYRLVDFKRAKDGIAATVKTIETIHLLVTTANVAYGHLTGIVTTAGALLWLEQRLLWLRCCYLIECTDNLMSCTGCYRLKLSYCHLS